MQNEKAFKQKILTAVTVPQVLTRSQCEMIIRDAEVIGMKRAPVLSKDGSHVTSRTRTCASCWLPKAAHFQWIYNYLAAVVDQVNTEHYRFDVMDMQNLQVLRYRPLQKFDWHFDTFDGSDRKLTASSICPGLRNMLVVVCGLRGIGTELKNPPTKGLQTSFPHG